jgi:hypothetical protein
MIKKVVKKVRELEKELDKLNTNGHPHLTLSSYHGHGHWGNYLGQKVNRVSAVLKIIVREIKENDK